MAIVQTLPVPLEPAPEATTAPQAPAMGSVSSLISGRPCPGGPAPPRHHGPPGPTFFRQQDGLLRGGYEAQEPLCPAVPPRKTVPGTSFTYINEDFRTESPSSPSSDIEDAREQRARNAHLRGPPPKLIPVSGKLEKNMEKILIRPTAFKPVLPKPRGAPSLPSFLGPRAAGLSGSQGSLTQLFGGPASSSSSSSSSAADRPLALSGWASGCPSGTLSDSGRNSLSSLPTYSTGGAEPASHSPGGHLPSHGPARGALPGPARGAPTGPSHSDSGRSSSSKSTGSLGGRVAGGLLGGGVRASPDSSSCGERSPPPPPPPPPPSDEALLHCVLEGKLHDREAELQQLRDSLDESEVTVCQAYEERQRPWPREREAPRDDSAAQAQRAQRAQQLLQLQVFQLQHEKRQLQDDFAQLLQEREQLERRCATFEREQRELGPRLEETKWEVCQKSGEISLLKQQLKESQAELVQKGSELVALRVALREARAALRVSEGRARGLQEAARARELELEACSQELQRHRQEAERLREKAGQLDSEAAGLREAPGPPATADPFLLAESDEAKVQRAAAGVGGSLRAQVERLRAELQRERRRGEEQQDSFEGERLAWQAEKEQVIRYQKQLQHNYIQMYRRNRQLEQELRQLSLELEARELAELGLAEPAPCICLEEITATEI
ncbi:PREDICTED: leucine zipper putative tumor suppressor 2 [Odobenus rosmarus divergens]|uniref:Leucine zipper putative tumor suppressor 2 n=1 Tax=Odobenus rosmarus divergens TaxID=9708 RepID=A0A2U3W228_ODORO|nr:PREDICTED: leucine zipper putative tumor suppressor 2 [Odobenus rosmarus divergens]XP_004401990.1 PREDICTED: leucine zipper putative tumor suppressor 2 [Odobenus rosmarus divergens]